MPKVNVVVVVILDCQANRLDRGALVGEPIALEQLGEEFLCGCGKGGGDEEDERADEEGGDEEEEARRR